MKWMKALGSGLLPIMRRKAGRLLVNEAGILWFWTRPSRFLANFVAQRTTIRRLDLYIAHAVFLCPTQTNHDAVERLGSGPSGES